MTGRLPTSREFFKDTRVFKTVIPRSIRLAEAPSHGKPILLYDPGSRGSEAYIQLAKKRFTPMNKSERRKALGKGLHSPPPDTGQRTRRPNPPPRRRRLSPRAMYNAFQSITLHRIQPSRAGISMRPHCWSSLSRSSAKASSSQSSFAGPRKAPRVSNHRRRTPLARSEVNRRIAATSPSSFGPPTISRSLSSPSSKISSAKT